MNGSLWSTPLWKRLAESTLWSDGVQASVDGRELPEDYARLYLLFDPTTFEPRYVGVTQAAAHERRAGHMKDARNGSQTYKARWIRELDDEPIIQEFMQLPLPLALVAEQALIYTLKEMGVRLTNTHAGGGGFDPQTEDAKERMRAGVRAAWARGAYPQESRKKAAERAWVTRRQRIADGTLQPPKSWNTGLKLDPSVGEAIRRARLKGRKPQQELVQLVANECGLGYDVVYRALKSSKKRPKPESIKSAWAAYERLGDVVADLQVNRAWIDEL